MKNVPLHTNAALLTFTVIGFGATSSPAWAQEAPASEPAIDLSANIGLVSDYRFRGISLSDRDPAIQGGVDLTTRAGWFVGTWASSIAEYGGAKTEVDVYAGYAREIGGVDFSAGAYAYFYPGGNGVNYVELQSSLGKTFGQTTIEAELSYVPDQKNTTSDNIYAGLSVTWSLGDIPISLKARGGFEDGFYEKKWDWEAGLLFDHGPLTASLSTVGSNYGGAAQAGRLAKTGVMAGLSYSF